jgi:transposase-like protein
MRILPLGNMFLQEPEGEQKDIVYSLKAQIENRVTKIVEQVVQASLDAEVDGWLKRGRHVRRRKSKRSEVKEYCSRCYGHDRRRFRRNGHYRRNLVTQWGKIEIGVPQVECECGGNVKLRFRTVRSRQRIWDDLELEIQIEYREGRSYRKIKAKLDEKLGTSFGLRTLNRRVLKGAANEIMFNCLDWQTPPPVVRVDGIWITVMFATGETQKDSRGRLRPVKKGKRIPILAAQGVWPTTGKTALLAWMLADGEDAASWQKFLEHLYCAGLTPSDGLKLLVADGSTGFKAAYENIYWMVPFQRCTFHKLRNVSKAIRIPAGFDRQSARQYRSDFLSQASLIWQAPDEHEARLLHAAFCQTWQPTQPKAVQTLTRDLDSTLTFYAVQIHAAEHGLFWPSHLLRTTSQLERLFREFRRRFRNALLFHSAIGAQAVTAQIAFYFS